MTRKGVVGLFGEKTVHYPADNATLDLSRSASSSLDSLPTPSASNAAYSWPRPTNRCLEVFNAGETASRRGTVRSTVANGFLPVTLINAFPAQPPGAPRPEPRGLWMCLVRHSASVRDDRNRLPSNNNRGLVVLEDRAADAGQLPTLLPSLPGKLDYGHTRAARFGLGT